MRVPGLWRLERAWEEHTWRLRDRIRPKFRKVAPGVYTAYARFQMRALMLNNRARYALAERLGYRLMTDEEIDIFLNGLHNVYPWALTPSTWEAGHLVDAEKSETGDWDLYFIPNRARLRYYRDMFRVYGPDLDIMVQLHQENLADKVEALVRQEATSGVVPDGNCAHCGTSIPESAHMGLCLECLANHERNMALERGQQDIEAVYNCGACGYYQIVPVGVPTHPCMNCEFQP